MRWRELIKSSGGGISLEVEVRPRPTDCRAEETHVEKILVFGGP
jgi:hypothetical protein